MNMLKLWLLIECIFKTALVYGQVYTTAYPDTINREGECYFYTALNSTIVPPINFPVEIDYAKDETKTDKIDNADKYQLPNPMISFIEGKDKWLFQVQCKSDMPGSEIETQSLDKECFAIKYENGTEVLNPQNNNCIWMNPHLEDHKLMWHKEYPHCVMQTFQIRFCSVKAEQNNQRCSDQTHCTYTAPITMREECTPPVPTIDSSTEIETQFQPIENEIFTLPSITQGSQVGCALDKTISYLTDQFDNNITSMIYDNQTSPWTVKPSPINKLDQQYKFKIYVYNTWYDTLEADQIIVYTLNVGCPSIAFSDIAGLIGDAQGSFSFLPGSSMVLEVQDSGTNIFSFTAGNLLPVDSYTCGISNTPQINIISRTSTYGPVTANLQLVNQGTNPCPNDGNPCWFLSVDSTAMQFEILFEIQVYVIGYQNMSIIQGINPSFKVGQINLTVTCLNHTYQKLSSPEPSDDFITEFILSFENPGNHSLYFNSSTCNITACCTLNYMIRNMDTGQLLPRDFYDENEPICLNCNGKNYFNINVFLEREPMRVRIEAINKEGFLSQSRDFVIAVIKFTQPCLTDTIEINRTMPDQGETQQFRDYHKTEQGPMLHIQQRVNQIPSYSINVVRRVQLGLPYQCPIVQYQIAKVFDAANTNETVEMFTYIPLIYMNPNNGNFIVKNFEKEVDWYILLAYDNGYRRGILDFIRLTILPSINQQKINEAPQFRFDLDIWEIVIDDLQNSELQKKLPEVFDLEGDEWRIEFPEDVPQFFKFFVENMTIEVNPDLINEKDLGIYKILIKLIDSKNSENSFMLTVEVRNKFQLEIKSQQFGYIGTQKNNQQIQEKVLPLSAKIWQINSMGLVKIKFNYTMQTPQTDPELPLNHSLGWINSSLFDIYIKQDDKYFDLEKDEMAQFEKQQSDKYNLTWWPVAYQEQVLEIQLKFNKPLFISKNAIRDRLVINLINGELNSKKFHRRGKNNTFWNNQTWTMKKPIRRQNIISDDPQNTSSSAEKVNTIMSAVAEGVMIVMIFSILIYLLTQSENTMRQFFIMVRALQLLMHVPIFNVLMPANLMSALEIFFPLLGFDLLELVLNWEQSPLKFDIEGYEQYADEHIFGQIVDMGYETPNTIIILNTLSILLLVYFIQFLVLVVTWVFVKATENEYGGQKFLNKLKYQLFFNELHSLYIGAFFEFGISSTLSYQYGVYKYSGDKVSIAIAYFSFFVCIIFLPISIIWVLMQSEETLNDEIIETQWGQLYSDVKIKSLWSRSYYLIFILRRAMYISLGMFVMHPVIVQLLMLQFMNIFAKIYQGQVMPSRSHFENNIDLINEYLIEMTCMSIILFTQWVDDPDLQYDLGWLTLSIILLCSFMNICLVLYYFGLFLKMLYQKLHNILNRYLANKEIQEKNKFYEENKEFIDSEIERKRMKNQIEDQNLEMDNKDIVQRRRKRFWNDLLKERSGQQHSVLDIIPTANFFEAKHPNQQKERQLQKQMEQENQQNKVMRQQFDQRMIKQKEAAELQSQKEEEELRRIKKKADLWRSNHVMSVSSNEEVLKKQIIPAQFRSSDSQQQTYQSQQTSFSKPLIKKETEASKHLKLLKSKKNVKISQEVPYQSQQLEKKGSEGISKTSNQNKQLIQKTKLHISSKDKQIMVKNLKLLKNKMSTNPDIKTKNLIYGRTKKDLGQKIKDLTMPSIKEIQTDESKESDSMN